MNKTIFILALSITTLIYSCKWDKEIDDELLVQVEPFSGFRKPEHFPEPLYHFNTNPVTENGFLLGRKLFYEPRLSRDNTLSCGSCHIQGSAFTHHGHDVSHGIDDRLGKRNAPAIMNLAWHSTFNLDGGVFDLDLQPIVPITTFEEMDETVDNVLNKLRNHPEYPSLFQKAYGSTEITSAKMLKALSQFMLMCISDNSKYDQMIRGEVMFTEQENAGYLVYEQNCSSCHTEPLFTDMSFRNNGIGVGFNNDLGRYEITLNPSDKYKFKVPTLRNLKYTAPYMHDGRFYNLNAVLTKYTQTMAHVENIDPLLDNGDGTYGIALTQNEKSDLLAFLLTLNDESFIKNRLLSEQ